MIFPDLHGRQQTKEEAWDGTEEQRLSLLKVVTALASKRDMHQLAYHRYWCFYHALAVPALIISSAIVVISGMQVEVPGLVAILSGVNTTLLALAQMLEYQSQKNAHMAAAKLYEKLKDKAFFLMTSVEQEIYEASYDDQQALKQRFAQISQKNQLLYRGGDNENVRDIRHASSHTTRPP